MTSTRSMEILVGVFVALGFAALFVLAMRVSNLSSFTDDSGYNVYAYFENIGGLKVRSPVTASGVRVGRVSGINYDFDNLQARVTLSINQAYREFPTDTAASIFTAGLLGEQYIALEPGAEEEFLAEGDELTITQSALVLEQIIGRMLVNMTSQ
ncbi:MAG: outer membrane lipid asymmetry maintenance protein MlaD [Gammaproteobacteria bacterium]